MTRDDLARWDDRYRREDWKNARDPYPLLAEHVPPIADGFALDLACGLGHNSIWLARHGYHVLGVDLSRVALEKARKAASAAGMAERVRFAQVDLDHYRPPAGCFDLVAVIRFLDRALFPYIAASLKPGGLLIYATLNWRRRETHPEVEPVYLLQPGELKTSFPGFELLHASEVGDHSEIVARKPRNPAINT
ncbi:MAG TPA: class I SAM-dependent methyltransferase [Aggregatilineales bacterium]|nr:class I SAM-dependent methyltransferase [Aggregatilineales bacterium]